MRGLFSAGVMDVLMENNIWPDGVIGVSAGAAFGCNMKSKQPGRAIRYNKKLVNDWRYASLRSLLTTGDYYGGEYAYHYMPRHIDYFDVDTFRENPMEFWAVCTNVGTGKAEYKRLMEVDNKLFRVYSCLGIYAYCCSYCDGRRQETSGWWHC